MCVHGVTNPVTNTLSASWWISSNELYTTITVMKQTSLVDVNAQVNLGNNFFVQAVMYVGCRMSTSAFCITFDSMCSPDARMVFVDVGVGGFHVEFTLDEAMVFISKKQVLLQRSHIHTVVFFACVCVVCVLMAYVRVCVYV